VPIFKGQVFFFIMVCDFIVWLLRGVCFIIVLVILFLLNYAVLVYIYVNVSVNMGYQVNSVTFRLGFSISW